MTRWQAVQRLELEFWSKWSTLALYRNLDVPNYWEQELAQFGFTWEGFRGLLVLDVGCGPIGLIHYLDHAAERICVDQLLTQYVRQRPLQGRQFSISAMGELLPLAARSVDLASCFNALGHMLDPDAALDEIARVLNLGGTALLMIHTFPGWLRPFYWIDRIHPHHYTAEAFVAKVKKRFGIEGLLTIKRSFDLPPVRWLSPSCWKYIAADMVVASTYIRASRAAWREPHV